MPTKTAKQYGLMQAIKHGKSTALKGESKPSKEVAKEFIDKTPQAKKKKFAAALLKR